MNIVSQPKVKYSDQNLQSELSEADFNSCPLKSIFFLKEAENKLYIDSALLLLWDKNICLQSSEQLKNMKHKNWASFSPTSEQLSGSR